MCELTDVYYLLCEHWGTADKVVLCAAGRFGIGTQTVGCHNSRRVGGMSVQDRCKNCRSRANSNASSRSSTSSMGVDRRNSAERRRRSSSDTATPEFAAASAANAMSFGELTIPDRLTQARNADNLRYVDADLGPVIVVVGKSHLDPGEEFHANTDVLRRLMPWMSRESVNRLARAGTLGSPTPPRRPSHPPALDTVDEGSDLEVTDSSLETRHGS